ncbi:hypothetical protein KC909_01905 [Candidatus Dojkabacteria bacterium]|uniref:Uncharacterized protein n=1 Tax=Candidatus Dojkabacteria bacterium TaxID=2099670 RepID=A0A955RIP2_9BACT|nr:hypothetical protein [Candidatus Dojkabacteria bacterium]
MAPSELPSNIDDGDDGRNSINRLLQYAAAPLITAVTETGATLYFLSQGQSLHDALFNAATLHANDITDAGAELAIRGARAMTDQNQTLLMGRVLNLAGSALDFMDGTRARSNGMLIHLFKLANRVKKEKYELPETYGSRWGGSVDVVADRVTEYAICQVVADAVDDQDFTDLMTAVGLSCTFSCLTKSAGLMQGISTPEEGDANMRQGTMRFRRMALNTLCAMARGYQAGTVELSKLEELAETIYTANIYTGMERMSPIQQRNAEFQIINTNAALKEARKYAAVLASIAEVSNILPHQVLSWMDQHGEEFSYMPDLSLVFQQYPETAEVADYFIAMMRSEDM